MQNDMPDEIVQRIMRYVDNHGWNWGIIKRLINAVSGRHIRQNSFSGLIVKATSL